MTRYSLSPADPKAADVYDFFLQWIGEWTPAFSALVAGLPGSFPVPSLSALCSLSLLSHMGPPGPQVPLLNLAAQWGDRGKGKRAPSWLGKWGSGTFSSWVCPLLWKGRARALENT